MKIEFNKDRPIYLQVREEIQRQIICGELKPNQKLLSVRELAILLKVNPNTIQKSLQELEDSKLIYTERTNGKFVTNDVDLIENLKNFEIERKVKEFLKDIKNFNVSKSMIIDIINKKED